MKNQLTTLTYSEYSSAGAKPINQDACGCHIIDVAAVTSNLSQQLKGHCFVLSDGISSSSVSQVASDLAVKTFLESYYLTPDTWTVIQSATTVIRNINATLYRRTQDSPYCYSPDRGYVCTFSVIIIKGNNAHIFHVGDACIGIFKADNYDIITSAHRTVGEHGGSFLANALGFKSKLDIEYHSIGLETKDTLVMMTDGVHEFVPAHQLGELVLGESLNNTTAERIVDCATANKSDDNLTCQVITIDQLANAPLAIEDTPLPLANALEEGANLDGYLIERLLYQSARSALYLAKETNTQERLVIKTLATELTQSEKQVTLFSLEEWLAKRITNPHVIKSPPRKTAPTQQYSVFQYVEGQTLAQWLVDNPTPSVSQVRDIVEQIANGLNAIHREGILHQDIRPENIMINSAGKCTIIDLGAAYVAGISELNQDENGDQHVLGTATYSAPEYFLGDTGREVSDLFSLAVLTYYMLSGRFPYGTNVAKARTISAQQRLRYHSVLSPHREIPPWLDDTLKRALQVNPDKRFQVISEFVYHLHNPKSSYLNKGRLPLIEKHPIRFWQGLCLALVISHCVTIILLSSQ